MGRAALGLHGMHGMSECYRCGISAVPDDLLLVRGLPGLPPWAELCRSCWPLAVAEARTAPMVGADAGGGNFLDDRDRPRTRGGARARCHKSEQAPSTFDH